MTKNRPKIIKERKSKHVYAILKQYQVKDELWSRDVVVKLAARCSMTPTQVYKW